ASRAGSLFFQRTDLACAKTSPSHWRRSCPTILSVSPTPIAVEHGRQNRPSFSAINLTRARAADDVKSPCRCGLSANRVGSRRAACFLSQAEPRRGHARPYAARAASHACCSGCARAWARENRGLGRARSGHATARTLL